VTKGRWAINIDVEGFSKKYEYSEDMKTFAISALRELMESIIKIGTDVYPGTQDNNNSERLFAHQFGDGFLISSDFYEESAERPIAIAISIMRHMMMKGFPTKAAISTGDMSDISGCYPKFVRKSGDNRVDLGMGIMTTTPVMGTAMTRAHKLGGVKSGAVLIVDKSRFESIPSAKIINTDSDINLIDWISSDLPSAKEISSLVKLEYGDRNSLISMFEWYIQQKPELPEVWINSSREAWHL